MIPGRTEMPDFGFHQGVVLAWDQSAGTSTIVVNGEPMADLPVAASGSVMVGDGDVVSLFRYLNQYFVMGRVASVGESLAIRFVTGIDVANFTVNAGFGDLDHGNVPTISNVYIGPSRSCIVFLSCALAGNTTGPTLGEAHFQVSGASDIPTPNTATPGRSIGAVGAGSSAARVIALTAADGLNTGLNNFEVKYRRYSGASNANFSNTVLVVLPL